MASIGHKSSQVSSQKQKYRVKFSFADRQFWAEVVHHVKACRLTIRTHLPNVTTTSATTRFTLTGIEFTRFLSTRLGSLFVHAARMDEPHFVADPKTLLVSGGLLELPSARSLPAIMSD